MVSTEQLSWGFQTLKSAVLDLHTYHWHDQILPFSILSTLHALRGALFFRYLLAPQRGSPQRITNVPWLQGLIVNLTLSLGGGVLSSMAFGRYIPWLSSNWTVPVYSLAHFLVMHSPLDLVFQIFYKTSPIVSPILAIADGINRGFALTSTIDYISVAASEPLRTSYVAMILGGTAAACGGGLLFDIFGMDSLEWRFRTPNFVRRTPYGVKAAFFISAGYVAAQIPELYFSKIIQSLLDIAPEGLKPYEKFFTGGLDISGLKALACLVFSAALILEEFSSTPQFRFLTYSDGQEKKVDTPDTSRASILEDDTSAETSSASLSEQSQYSRSNARLSSVGLNSPTSLRKRDIYHTPKKFSENS